MERLPGLSCREPRQRVEVGLIGCPAVKARMRPPAVVEHQIPADRNAGLRHAVVGSQIHLLVFDGSPEPLNKDIVPPGSFAVHADGDLVLQQDLREVVTGELAGLR